MARHGNVGGVVMLLANRDGSLGGAQQQTRLLAPQLTRRGLHVIVVNQSPGRRPPHRARAEDGVERVALPVSRRATRWSFLLSFLLWAIANRRRFDVIHAQSTSAGLTAGLVGRLLGRRVIVKVTGMHAVAALTAPGASCRVRRWLLESTADVLVAVSGEMMQALTAVGIARDRRALIPNGVLPLPDAAERRAPETGRPVVLYVGRLEPIKGVSRLLSTWSHLPRGDAATLMIVGDGPLRAALERDTVARGLEGSVRFLGSRPEVGVFYRMADVFVLPSMSEGLSNALLEAMAAGLPVVASDVAGNREVVEHAVSGFLVDWSDAAAAAALVRRLLDDAPLRRRIGDAAARRAGCFSITVAAERYCDLYRAVVSGHRRAAGAAASP